MITILSVVGARPQFIKAAVVSRALRKFDGGIEEILVHTGQHYDANMSEVFFDELDIPRPAHNLRIGGGTHGQNTGRMLEQLETLMLTAKPDCVLVYGDTDSTLAGSLAAAKLHIPIAHVEAGLRSFNRRMPEEINRVLTDHLASTLFAPTELARRNLVSEGISDEKIFVVGDVMYDAALYYGKKARKPAWFERLDIDPGDFVLCTIHRAENTEVTERMSSILTGLSMGGLPVILPLHPRTRITLERANTDVPSNIRLVDPVSYFEMLWLEANCRLIATDSGGVQKEAYFQNKPCVTLRDETEWIELVESGTNTLVGSDANRIARAINDAHFKSDVMLLYGNGYAGEEIANILSAIVRV